MRGLSVQARAMLARDVSHQIQDLVREHGNVEIRIWDPGTGNNIRTTRRPLVLLGSGS
jgi:anti-sigma regulatory factor (Ser/Thr protein kinase)